jgi:hypothetical protein
MTRILSLVIVVAGAWTALTGGWGLVEAGSNSTAELQEIQRWISGALLTAGIGLIATGLERLLPALERGATDDSLVRQT